MSSHAPSSKLGGVVCAPSACLGGCCLFGVVQPSSTSGARLTLSLGLTLSLYTHHARFTGLLLMDSCRSLRFVHSCLWIVWLGAHYAGLTSLDRSLDYCTWTRWFHFAGWSHIVHITGWLYLQHEDQKQDNRASRGWSSVSKEDWMAPRRLAREPKDGLHGCNLSLVK